MFFNSAVTAATSRDTPVFAEVFADFVDVAAILSFVKCFWPGEAGSDFFRIASEKNRPGCVMSFVNFDKRHPLKMARQQKWHRVTEKAN
jgi:hypothetical protein